MISALVFFATFAVIGWLATVLPRVVGAVLLATFSYLSVAAFSCGMPFNAAIFLIEGMVTSWALFGIARLNSASPTCTRQP